jgi:hypothetical protein
MEQQEELKIGIGNEEAITLKPVNVKIQDVKVEEVGTTKKGKKVICACKHPDNELPIKISAVKYEKKGKLETSGLWVNLDSKKLIRKDSALAVFLNSVGAKTIEELKDKSIGTCTDEKGYLCFKAY